VNNADSAAVRVTGLPASTPTLSRLTVANGVAAPVVTAYSATYGQAFGPGTVGDGTWGTALGGPGGALSRTLYEQFTVSVSANYSARIDSIVFNSSFYNTTSGVKMAVVYSLSGFTTDSADVTGGIGLGLALAAGATGGFTCAYYTRQ